MEKYITDEQNGLEYERVGDYYIVAGEDEPPARPIGVWGARRRDFLKQHRQGLYFELLFSGKLNDHLADVEEQAQGVTEDLKRRDQMTWVGAVNNIRNQIEEIIRNDLIYV